MPISAQSKAVVDALLRGETLASDDTALGPLEEPAKVLLKMLAEPPESLAGRKGADQAKELRRLYVALQEESTVAAATACQTTKAAPLPSEQGPGNAESPIERHSWRLISLKCRSFRGIAPAGDTFIFHFDGKSCLIYGPNGSGKSSLLGAIVWVLTGQVLADTDDSAETSPVYRCSPKSLEEVGRGRKIRDWPIVATIPENVNSGSPECLVELELADETGNQMLYLKRSEDDCLEFSSDRQTWEPCSDISRFGMDPLDIQLSLIAPTVFGRRSIEEAKDTRSLLSLMLGYDDLEVIGELASKLAGNCTRLAKAESKNIEEKQRDLRAAVTSSADSLRGCGYAVPRVDAILKLDCPAGAQVEEALSAISGAVDSASSRLANSLGLSIDDEEKKRTLAEKLIASVATLEKGVEACFPALQQLEVSNVLEVPEGSAPADVLAGKEDWLRAFKKNAKLRIANRLQWWRQESVPGSKDALLLEAAEYYEPEEEQCPVCSQPIGHLPLKDKLADLKDADSELRRELDDFFRDLLEEVQAEFPRSVRAISEKGPSQRLLADWQAVKEEAIGPDLEPAIGDVSRQVEAVAGEVALEPVDVEAVLPEDVEEEAVAAAHDVIQALEQAHRALAILKWSSEGLVQTKSRLHSLVSSPTGGSVLQLLARGKQDAMAIGPLKAAFAALNAARNLCAEIEALRRNIEVLEDIRRGLEQLKPSSKYAASQVEEVFLAIRNKTLENWKLLYPESSSGLEPFRLVLGKGRDKSVEGMLAYRGFELPQQFFGNAGLQRAVALSFYSALLDVHPRGLGIVVMDDPILSLDDDHRESWSCNVLRPHMDKFQVVVATHQMQFLNNCKHIFADGFVVELNPRRWARRISYRPGLRIDRAEQLCDSAWQSAPTELRKHREEVLATLEAYSPAPFLNRRNLKASWDAYAELRAPSPLAGRAQGKIVATFGDPRVDSVLDPGSHSLTEADVTLPMVRACIGELRKREHTIRTEFERLDALRLRELRRSAIPSSLVNFSGVPGEAGWEEPIPLRLIGNAAAKGEHLVLDMSMEPSENSLQAGRAVLVASDTLDPIARCGQWALLAVASAEVQDGDLVAALTSEGNRLLRRVWSDGRYWILQSANPVRWIPCVRVAKREAALRKIMGVLYGPIRSAAAATPGRICEWQPRNDFRPEWLASLDMIEVEGDSLDPIVLHGQRVLVEGSSALTNPGSVRAGLAAVATKDSAVGNLIKRVFPGKHSWTLLSPNPVHPHEPLTVAVEDITDVRLLRGAVFEFGEPEA